MGAEEVLVSQSKLRAGPLLIDAHVHFHPCFERNRFLDAAAVNFTRAARSLGLSATPIGVLLLTESADVHFFSRFRDSVNAQRPGPWGFRLTEEEISLAALKNGDPHLILVAGRQVVTAEGLEVLALCCDAALPDGLPVRITIESIRRGGGLPVVPWGFGKWWFRRGRLVSALMKEQDPRNFCVGDNGGRLRYARRPRQFLDAMARGIRVLPGSDPLPFPHQIERVGSFGLSIPGPHDLRRPAKSILVSLRSSDTDDEPFGQGERLLPFLRAQLAIQLRKRFGGKSR